MLRCLCLLVISSVVLGQDSDDCVDRSGRRHLRGQTWQNNCNTYQCEADGVKLIQKGCMKADSTCFYEGDTYQYHCYTYRCDIENGRAVRRQIYAGCAKADGTCFDVGAKYSYFCYNYLCSLKGGLPRREMTSQACSYFERCISVGETIQHGRRQYRCSSRDRGQLVWERVESEFPGCYTDSGALVPEGGTRRDECSVYRCEKSSSNSYAFKLETTGCKNSRGECVDVGASRFPCYVDGRFEINCICRENNGGEAVIESAAAIRTETSQEISGENLVKPVHCQAPGTGSAMAVGRVVVYECAEYICEQGIISDTPQLRVLGRDCRTADGRCIRPGTKSFPCVHEGKRHEKCTCSVGKDGALVYSVMPEKCVAKDGTSVVVGNTHMIDCVTYKCLPDGSLSRVSQGCKSAEGRCIRLGADNFACLIDGVRHEKCKCILNMDGDVEYLVDMMKPLSCKTKDGRMIEEGQTHLEKCITYTCIKSGDLYELLPTKTECQTTNGSCVPVGSRKFPCRLNDEDTTCTCQVNTAGSLVYTEVVTEQGCLTETGRLLQEGEKIEIDCAQHVCERDNDVYRLTPESVECKTIDGRCVKPGTRGFPCMINGQRHSDCECVVNATGRVEYTPVTHCTSKYGDKVSENKTIRIDCVDYECRRVSGSLKLNLLTTECRTSSGDCLPVGSDNFPCLINGAEYDSCSCTLTPSGDVRYTAKALQGVEGCRTKSGDVLKDKETKLINCITYECTKEGDTYTLRPETIECKTADGSCLPAGSVGFACDIRGARYDRCRCDLNSEGQLLYSALATECTALDGSKVKIGETYSHHCNEYTCVEKGNGLSLDLVKRECRTSDDTCVPVGTAKFPCEINGVLTPYCTCKLDKSTNDMIYYKNGCDFRGEFLLRDEKKVLDCIEYQCQLDGQEWVVSPSKIECQSADNECLPVGSENFPCLDNAGARYDSCRCDLDANQKVVYSLRQSACPVNHLKDKDVFEDQIKIGESVTSQCVTYTCQSSGQGLELAVTNIACTTNTGECKPLGSTGFPCQLGDHCQCEKEGDSIRYSVYGCYVDGHYLYPGDYKEVNCTEYACKERDGNYVTEVTEQIGCPGEDSSCNPVGSAPFRCTVQGQTHDKCQCRAGEDGKLYYAITDTEEPVKVTTVAPTSAPTTEAKAKATKSERKAGTNDGDVGNCYFPFTHDGQEYDDCIKDGDSLDRPWCPLTDNYPNDQKIGYCFPKTKKQTADGVPCNFPFAYDGNLYYDCIYAWTGDWCATTADYDADGEYGKCA